MKILFFCLLVIIGLFPKKIKWYDALIIIFIIAISIFGKNVADFQNYKRAYTCIEEGRRYLDLGIGWYYLCKIGTIFRLSYIQFKVLITIISYVLINNSIKFFLKGKDEYKKLIWVFYLVFPLLLDLIQVRYLIAQAIVLYFFRFLISDKKMRSVVLFDRYYNSSYDTFLYVVLFNFYTMQSQKEL